MNKNIVCIGAGYIGGPTMAVMLFIGGMLKKILGPIGEYIGRIYICINQSPQFIVSKATCLSREDA